MPDVLDINPGVQTRALGLDVKAPAEGRTLAGYAVRWNEWTPIGGGAYMERFAPGSWDDSIAGGNVKVIAEHGMDPQLGMRPIASLRSLVDDGTGAAYEADLLDAAYVEPLLPALRAGLYGSSFRFNVPEGGQTINRRPGRSEHNPQGVPEVTITRANIVELGPTSLPAYAGSTASLRSSEVTPPEAYAPATNPTEGTAMPKSVEELVAEATGFRNRMTEINAEFEGRAFSSEAQSEFDEQRSSLSAHETLIDELRSRQAVLDEIASKPEHVEHERSIPQIRRSGVARGEDIYDLTTIRSSFHGPDAGELRDRAMRSIEGATFARSAGDADLVRSGVEQLIEGCPDIARHVLITGSPAYRSAFKKTIMGQPLNGDEIRAMSLTGANGGFAQIPYQLDPTIIKTGALAINPYRAVARSVQINGTNKWDGVSSGAVVASWDAEGAEVSDDSPTYAQPSIACFKANAFVPFSYELGEDYPNLLTDLGGLIAEAKDTLEATAFTTGNGTTAPKGILTAATTTVTAGGTAAFAVADLYALDNAVPARYQINASILGNRAILNRVRQFDTTNGNTIWGSTANLSQGSTRGARFQADILGYPTFQVTDMVSALTTGNKILVEGDFDQYVIVDRIGMSVELVPNLFGASGRPTGQRGLMAHWRVGADVTNAAAFRVLVTG